MTLFLKAKKLNTLVAVFWGGGVFKSTFLFGVALV